MKWAKSRKPTNKNYWYVDHGEIAFVLSILVIAAVIVIWVLAILLNPGVATAGDVTNYRQVRRLAAPAIHSDIASTRHSVPVVTILCTVTAYSPTVAETDGNPLRTASGKRVYVGGIAADLDVLPFGSIVIIPNYNGGKPCQVVDTGSAIKGNKLDVFMWKTHEAVHFGRRRNVRVEVLYRPKAKP